MKYSRIPQVVNPNLKFIWQELMNDAGRNAAKKALAAILASAITSILAPYGLGLIVNGFSTNSVTIVGIGVATYWILSLTENLIDFYYMKVKEVLWQQNFWYCPQQLTRLFLQKTLGSLIASDNNIDGGGVESLRDKVFNLMRLYNFDIIPNYAHILFASIACLWVNPLLGTAVLAYIVVDTSVAKKQHRYTEKGMEPVIEEMRIWSKRMRNWWDAYSLVKCNGVENRIIHQVADEIQPTIKKDDAIWRIYFPGALLKRRLLGKAWTLGLYGYGAHWTLEGQLPVEAFVLLIFSFQRIVWCLDVISNSEGDRQRDLKTVENYRKRLLEPVKFDCNEGGDFDQENTEVQFTNVSLTMGINGEAKQILKDVCFTIKNSERVGIVGPSGAGKTQLINLILRAYDPDAGSVKISAINLRNLKLTSWLSHVGYVPQDAIVFEGTIRENVTFAEANQSVDEADEKLVWSALEKAGLDFGGRLTHGLDTLVGPRGLRLSGGQRQRLMIAQAIYKMMKREQEGRPQLVIADEATSALDSLSEAHVLSSLYEALPQQTTMVLIAHRLSSLYGCNSILFVKPLEKCRAGEPQVTKHCSLAKLFETEPLFREMADAQGFKP